MVKIFIVGHEESITEYCLLNKWSKFQNDFIKKAKLKHRESARFHLLDLNNLFSLMPSFELNVEKSKYLIAFFWQSGQSISLMQLKTAFIATVPIFSQFSTLTRHGEKDTAIVSFESLSS
jgi:hypothetical protein